MVFNSAWVATVATLSAELCQYIACNPQRLPAGEVLRLLCYAPLHLAGRLAAGVFSFFCFPIAAPPSPSSAGGPHLLPLLLLLFLLLLRRRGLPL
ncbi:unnamed protein product [Spirodela intermedia]|uniref:Uncharacterized protein n=1 Tax=Spirodela intermedia TaxID=51605 RepID=A0A7I8I7R3_SPIIN|nr:unnamed protein product [Spirodela intermedia]CAA6653655.1 unnamed protein product [Spirodela intermedia]